MNIFNIKKLVNNDINEIEKIKSIKLSVVYRYYHLHTGKSYIGVTKDLYHRLFNKKYGYIHIIRTNRYVSSKIHKILKSDYDNMSLEIIYESDNVNDCYNLESKFISLYDSYNNGYNSTPDGTGIFGNKFVPSSFTKYKGVGIWINNGLRNKLIFIDELDEYLSKGWVKGMIIHKKINGNAGKVFMKKDSETIRVDKSEIEFYKELGYELGRIFTRKDVSNKTKGKIYVNKNKKNYVINKSDLSSYLGMGFIEGKYIPKNRFVCVNNGIKNFRIPIDELNKFLSEDSDNSKGWINSSLKGKIWIKNTSLNIEKLIDKSELNIYLNKGYIKGKFHKTNTKGRVRINNGITNTTVEYDKLNEMLNSGWVLGMIKRSK